MENIVYKEVKSNSSDFDSNFSDLEKDRATYI